MHRMPVFFLASFLVTLLLTLAGPATAADPAPATGTLHVTVHGSDGPSVVLVPGLGSGPWVWEETIARLENDYRLYALTLAGFDGTPAPQRTHALFEQAQASLLQLIEQENIDKPVLVGHSLGGTLAIAFGSRHPELVAGVVAVDGLPIFPGMERLPVEQRLAAAKNMAAMYAGLSQEQFAAQQVEYLRAVGVLDETLAASYGAHQARSNPAIVAALAGELLALDLRPELPGLTVPLLEIGPYNQPDFEAAAAAGLMPQLDQKDVQAYYTSFLEGAPQAEVVILSPARHFVMADQPESFHETLLAFLHKHANGQAVSETTRP